MPAAQLVRHELEPGQVLFAQGDSEASLFIVAAGVLEVTRRSRRCRDQGRPDHGRRLYRRDQHAHRRAACGDGEGAHLRAPCSSCARSRWPRCSPRSPSWCTVRALGAARPGPDRAQRRRQRRGGDHPAGGAPGTRIRAYFHFSTIEPKQAPRTAMSIRQPDLARIELRCGDLAVARCFGVSCAWPRPSLPKPRAAAGRAAEAAPPFRPPLREDDLFSVLPRPEPLFLPPPLSLFTVAQARRSASSLPTPRFS